jgi:hypothetical protein
VSDYGIEFSDLASDLVAEFSEELGQATLKHLTGSVYSDDTGARVPTYANHQALMVFDEIETEGDKVYEKEHQLCIIAGNDITVVPDNGDFIIKQSGTSHKIVAVLVDQYEAAYNLHIERKPS